MGKPETFLEGLSGHALSLGAETYEGRYEGDWQRDFAQIDGTSVRIGKYARSSRDEKELRETLDAAAQKPARAILGGRAFIIDVRIFEHFGEAAFEVSLNPAPKPDPSVAPLFTARQGQYLAYIYNYT